MKKIIDASGYTSAAFKDPTVLNVGEEVPVNITNEKVYVYWGPKAPLTRITAMGADTEVHFAGRVFVKGHGETFVSTALGWTPEQWKEAHIQPNLTIESLDENGHLMGKPDRQGREVPRQRIDNTPRKPANRTPNEEESF